MNRISTCLLIVLLFVLSGNVHAQLQITQQSNALQLAQRLVGGGVSISNVTLRSSPGATAFFKRTAGTLPGLDSGILLTNGSTLLNGAASLELSESLFIPGDAALSALVNQPTSDATILEFDFVPLGDSVKFRYVFSSEEYPDYVCTEYNDVFAFFLSGPGITGTVNLARIPGTNIPVSINSINSGIPGPTGLLGSCTMMGAGSPFTQYYIDNFTGTTFRHNGLTKVLIAAAAVMPCQTYHLRLAIADAGQDDQLDSGVFIEARSLSSPKFSLVDMNPVAANGKHYLVEGCNAGGVKVLSSAKRTVPQVVQLSLAGTGTAADLTPIPPTVTIPANDSVFFVPFSAISDNIAEGTERVKIYVAYGCTGVFHDSIELELRDYGPLSLGSSNGNYCKYTPLPMNASAGFATYQWTPSALFNDATLQSPVLTPAPNTWVYCDAAQGSCKARDSVLLQPKLLSLLWKKDVLCKNGNEGSLRASGGPLWTAPVNYGLTGGSAGTDSTFTGLVSGTYSVFIQDATGCRDTVSAISIIQAFPDLTLSETVVAPICSAVPGTVTGTGAGGKLPYQFAVNTGSFGSSATFQLPAGNYTLSVRDANGCVTDKPITVTLNQPVFTPTLAPASCLSNGSITVTGGAPGFTYALGATGSFGQSNVLSAPPGNNTVRVSNGAGCIFSYPVDVPMQSDLSLTVTRADTICQGSTYRFVVSSNAQAYSWSGGSLANPTAPMPQVSPAVSTNYYVDVTRGRCTARDSVHLFVRLAPIANAGPDTQVCVGGTLRLQGSGGFRYSWTPVSSIADPTVSNPLVNPPDTMFYLLNVVDIFGCPSLKADSVKVLVVPAVQVFAGRDTVAAQGQPLQLNGVELSPSGATRIEWSPAIGLSDPYILDPVAILNVDTTLRLTLTTPAGCTGYDLISIKVYKEADIFVPTAFTPNGDGRNDVVRPRIVGIRNFRYLRIFNRWGQLVFETSEPSLGWDGRINGKQQDTSLFVWIAEGIDYRGRLLQRKGTLTLIR